MDNILGTAPQNICGPVVDLLNKVQGPTGGLWLQEFKRFLRKEKTWSSVINIDRSQPLPLRISQKDSLVPLPAEEGQYGLILRQPGLEDLGPSEIDMNQVLFWDQDQQPEGVRRCYMWLEYKGPTTERWKVSLLKLYTYLVESGLINSCFGLREGYAIASRCECAPDSFRFLPLWKGLASREGDGKLFMPVLSMCTGKDQTRITWMPFSPPNNADSNSKLVPLYPGTLLK